MLVNIKEIAPYGKNTDFFNDLTGEDFEELKESILEHGILQPIVVNADYIIISGHQRYRACLELGITEVPIHVINTTEVNDLELKLIESNIRTRKISTSEMAWSIRRLYEIYDLRHGVKKEFKRRESLGDSLETLTLKDVANSIVLKLNTINTLIS